MGLHGSKLTCAHMYKQHHSVLLTWLLWVRQFLEHAGGNCRGSESVATIIAASVRPCQHTQLKCPLLSSTTAAAQVVMVCTGDCCRCQHMKDHQQAVPHRLLLQARPAMTSHQIPIAARNKRSGASAVKAGCQYRGLIPPMATVQKPVDGADIIRWSPIWDSCLLRYSAG